MSAPLAGKFQDHYQVLGVDQDASSEVIQRAYSFLAPKYHRDNKDTADPEKFEAVTLAFEVLSDPVTKQMFDSVRAGSGKETGPRFVAEAFFNMMTTEMPRRHCILCVLYDRRRQQPLHASLSLKQLEMMVEGTPEELHFSLWYLKQKGYAVSDDKSNLQISVQGMDYLDAVHPTPESIRDVLKAAPPAQVVEREPETSVAPEVAPEKPAPVEPAKPQMIRRTIVVPQSRVQQR
ncbi:MAG: DnaJ domain-containing protein [Acidobacteriia bacterium]|nr:DnaJ domain-containing protein [Terriglobia bacterium]